MTPKFRRIRTSICDFGEVLGSRRSQRWRSTKKTDAIREKAKFCGRPGPDKILDQPPGFFSNFDKILWVGPQNWRTSGDPLISPHPHQHLRFWRGVPCWALGGASAGGAQTRQILYGKRRTGCRPGFGKVLDRPPGFLSNFEKILWVGPQN